MLEAHQVEIEFAETHGPLFVPQGQSGPQGKGGKNMNTKLSDEKFNGIRLIYDRRHRELHVYWEKRRTIVPREAVAFMWEPGEQLPPAKQGAGGTTTTVVKPVEPTSPKPVVKAQVGGPADVAAKAQVSTPTSHVFEGPGKGKT
jgi:hypothetical protein